MPEKRTGLTRLLIFLAVAGLHLIFIFFFVITLDAVTAVPEQPAAVMKLTDLAEEEPPPPPPPPPPPQEESRENVVETIAENMIETEEVPPEQVLAPPGSVTAPPVQYAPPEEENYLPMHLISSAPVFSEREILRALVYPAIPLRSGIEGMVYLELFIDREGLVKRITVLKETPPERGFGEAAVKAFEGMRCKPAEANGQAVAVRFRYPVRFKIRG
jgi:protein TonB